MKRSLLHSLHLLESAHAPPKNPNPIPFVDILKAEVKKISNQDLDRDFFGWMISCHKSYEAFFLRPDHFTDASGFIQSMNKPASGSIQEIIRKKLSAGLLNDLTNAASPAPVLMQKLADELNSILSQKQLLFPEELLNSSKLFLKTAEWLNNHKSVPNYLALNRVLFELAFSNCVVEVKNTLPGVYAWIHDHPKTALCISGGGIRSATFGLGMLQGLARHGLMGEFDYLSTVSGGGYVGSWLSAWIARNGMASNVFGILDKFADKTPIKPEPEQITHLREFSNYLTPRLGLLSADTWTLIGTYLRNLILNWVIFIPALTTLLLIPRAFVALFRVQVNFAGLCAVGIVGLIGAIWAIAYAALHRPSVWNPRIFNKGAVSKGGTQIRFLWFCYLPLCISALCFTTLWIWLQNSPNGFAINGMIGKTPTSWLTFVIIGALIHCAAWCCYCFKLPKHKVIELLSVMVTGGFGGLLLWLGAQIGYAHLSSAPNLEWYVCLAAPYYLVAFLVTATLFIGLTSRLTADSDREWWARMGAWLLIGVTGWSLFSILVLFGPQVLCDIPHVFVSLGGISTIITLLFSYNSHSPANKSKNKEPGVQPVLIKIGLAISAPLFIACLISALSLGTACVFKSMQFPTLGGTVKFRSYDITDLPALASNLKQHSTKFSALIWTNLSQISQHKLLADTDNSPDNTSLRKSLISDLNQIITNRIYDPVTFNEVNLSSRTEIMNSYRANLSGQRLMRFNRLVLEDAFPESIARSDFDPIMITHWTEIHSVVLVFVILGAIAWILSRFININKFSLYAVYRNRIIRAYLGASNPARQPNPFSGFDPDDNIRMCELQPRPFHVINITLNLVEGEDMAWQQRKAESFTASPTHAGNYILGYRNVEEYASHRSLVDFLGRPEEGTYDSGDTEILKSRLANDKDNPPRGLTLGAAVTISGAAASPNSGYHSSPVIAMIMTLFNVRLGAWLGNPGKAGNKTFTHRAPRSAVWHVVKEALGLTDDKAEYVYLSDGGHFENLGLYEMVLRRCHFIVVSDAGCDPDCALEDLGNAIRKIRIDLGIPIEISQFNIASRAAGKDSKYCAIGIIDYSHVDGAGVEPGVLIYIKPAISGTEPRDVFNYKESSVLFPHEPTSDQWFSESQFESYRILAMHIIEVMCNGANGQWNKSGGNLLEHFKNQTSDYLNQVKNPEQGFK